MKPSAHIVPDQNVIAAFRKTVYRTFRKVGRDLPWRGTDDPYRILVSEFMLQQTQVGRVIEKYGLFLKRFPDLLVLARAPLAEVMAAWQGLGYNRRALMLKRTADVIVVRFAGVIPSDENLLRLLPGIGSYTAAAVCVFAFNQPVVLIETNIRSVFIHHFFPDRRSVHDDEIRPLIEATLDRDNTRLWYTALMDWGAALKSRVENPGRKSAHYSRQSPFEGSDRQIRGRILKRLVERRKRSARALIADLGGDSSRIRDILVSLEREGLVVKEKRSYRIA
ncbi:A/G-specific adenine glycosylase [Candidatus Latescibacterota bacterium]